MTLQPWFLETSIYDIGYKQKTTDPMEQTVEIIQIITRTQRSCRPCGSRTTNDVCATFIFSFTNRSGGNQQQKGREGCGVFSPRLRGWRYLYFRDVFCFLPCQLHLQFCNFSFQQVDHFLVVLLRAVGLSLHDLCHLQLAVQRPVLGEEAQGFLEAARSSAQCTTSPSAANPQNRPEALSKLFANLVQPLKLIFH